MSTAFFFLSSHAWIPAACVRRLFKECPHPDEKQRGELSKRLGLDPRQVKFWFQNRRTQMKVCYDFASNQSIFFS
jgi:hypothetical protein